MSVLPAAGCEIGVGSGLSYNRSHILSRVKLTPWAKQTSLPVGSGAPAERLDSWKEIAAYLKRDERRPPLGNGGFASPPEGAQETGVRLCL